MFTGLIEEVGTVSSINIHGKSGNININAKTVLENTKEGDSIAVNGVCLTVTSVSTENFTADIMAETAKRSSIGKCFPGDNVNLERAMSAGDRFGGHIVTGHIDGIGKIISKKKDENSVRITISTEQKILNLIVEKGSIAIDGISLTVAEVTNSNFTVCIIPHTGNCTTLIKKSNGSIVNIENDIVGKYVNKIMKANFCEYTETKKENLGCEISMNFLEENGF